MNELIITFLVILSIPIIGGLSAGAIIGIFAIIVESISKRDVLFWYRKRQSRKKLRNSHFKKLAGVFDFLLLSAKKDWSYDAIKKEISFMLSECYTVRYGPHYIAIYYKKVRVFHLQSEPSKWSGVTGELSHDSKEQVPVLLMEEVLSHLCSINKQIFEERNEEQERQSSTKEREKEEAMEKKASQLKQLLCELETYDRAERNEFMLATTEQSSNIIYEFFYQNIVYFEALYNKKTGKIQTRFLNETNEDANIFRLAENEIMKVVYTLFSCQELEPRAEIMAIDEQNVQRILEKVEYLAMEEKWLDVETNHQLTQTIPHDLKDLLHLYSNLEDKTKVEEKFTASIGQIEEQLRSIKEKIEENKRLKFDQKTTVIEKRTMSRK